MIRGSICKKELCASDRDQILLNESRENSQFKRDLAEAIRQSNELFPQSTKELSQSMLAVASGITKSVEIFSQALSNQNQQASPPYIYQSLPYIHLQTQHSLMLCSQHQRNVAQFQQFSFSSVPDSANSQGGEFTTLMDSELRRDDKKDKLVIIYTLTTSVLLF